MKVFAVFPEGLVSEGEDELKSNGARNVQGTRGGVFFEADLQTFYRIHLYSRLSFRFLRQMAVFKCSSPKSLYSAVQRSIDWGEWLTPDKTFRVNVSGFSSELNHSHFSALQVKNAIVDFQRNFFGARSNVELKDPDLCIHLHISRGAATLSFESSAKSLHKRGYRVAMGFAPLKENLAAGLIKYSKWDFSTSLIDPLCGSGTFLIEAASMAMGFAPGLNRKFLFENWIDHDENLWIKEKKLAQKISIENKVILPKIIGCEINSDIADQARSNIKGASLEKYIEVKNIHFDELSMPKEKGLLICNPPYGKRIESENNLQKLYKDLGKFCKLNASGWELWILSGNPKLTQFLGMKSSKRLSISNGGIDCKWLNYKVN